MYYHQRRRFRKIAEFAVGQTVLDIGCAQEPNPYFRGTRVVGLDLNDMPIRPPYTEHVVGDTNDINELLGGQTFDTIVMAALIEHVERPYDVLRAVRGHIAPGGRLILSTPNPFGIPRFLAEFIFKRRFFYTPQHVYCFPVRWVWRLLERSGYRVVKTVGTGAGLYGFWCPAPAVISGAGIYVAEPLSEDACGPGTSG